MQWYSITDIDKFVDSTRVLVYRIFGKNDVDFNVKDSYSIEYKNLTNAEQLEINECLTENESMLIAMDFIKKIPSKKGRQQSYKISDKAYMSLIESLNARLVSNMLNKMVRQGLLETAYDAECDDFIFWVKEDEDENKNKNTET